MRYTVVNMGVDTAHGRDFYHRLPQGMPFWVFLHMLTPHRVNTGGQMVLSTPGTCILYPPDTPRYLFCPENEPGFRNNWLHFEGDDVAEKLKKYDIPVEKFFMLKQTMPIVMTLQELNYEYSQVSAYRSEMQSTLIELLLLQIGRYAVMGGDPEKTTALRHYQNFEQLRRKLYLNPEADWTIPTMANAVFIGQNQFIALYRGFFHVTPKRDLINARIQKAKNLLDISSTMREVAQACGYQNEYYFSAAFKQITGMTPGQFRGKMAKTLMREK